MPEISCDNCNKLFNKPARHIKRSNHHFCSKECYWQHKDKKHTVKCDNCGKKIMRNLYRVANQTHHFCDTHCKSQWNKNNSVGSETVRVACAACGKEVIKILADAKRRKVHFCTHKCMGKYYASKYKGSKSARYTDRVEVVCKNCGSTEKRTLYVASKTKDHFCSRKCLSEYGRIDVHCSNCNKVISKPASRDKSVKNHYCSKSCLHEWMSKNQTGKNNPNFKGGPNYYGPNWKKQRNAARKRDGHKCQSCGMSEAKLGRELDVHHIKPFKKFACTANNDNYKKANKLTNLISLCPACHKAAEWGSLAIQPNLL